MSRDQRALRYAWELIKEFGADAVMEAACAADECLDKGDMDGQRLWIQVIRAVEEIQGNTPNGSTVQ